MQVTFVYIKLIIFKCDVILWQKRGLKYSLDLILERAEMWDKESQFNINADISAIKVGSLEMSHIFDENMRSIPIVRSFRVMSYPVLG